MGENIPYFALPGGYKIPSLGLGTTGTDESAIESALEAGYRLFDTATNYKTEKNIGNVVTRWINAGKIKREELFLTTKLPQQGMRPAGVHKYVQESLENLQVNYIDLYLIHGPVGLKEGTDFFESIQKKQNNIDATTDLVAIWKAMEEEVEAGRLRSIGLSNFNIKQIQRIIDNATIPVANLQAELHAYHQQKQLVKFCKANNITVTSYFSLGSPHLAERMASFGQKFEEPPSILENPVVISIAQKHDKSFGQILLRHLHQKGILLIPKSTNAERQKQNLNIFDFELDDEDVAKVDALDKEDLGKRVDMGFFPGYKDHPEYPHPK